MVNLALFVVQLAVTVVVGIYFFRQLRQQKRAQPAARRESNRELENLRKMRSVHLSEPLAEKVRPSNFKDIIGQEEGIKSLKAILCGANPQHVLIYGPPGIGKTCAAGWCWRRRSIPAGRLLQRMRPLLKWMPPAFALMSAPLPTRCWGACMIPSTRGLGRWAYRESRSRNPER